MLTTTTKPPSQRTLKQAAKLIQEAHDWIEEYGFDIDHYGFGERSSTSRTPSMCYIGTLRFHADPDLNPDPGDNDPAFGDGPELGIALAILDEIAKPRIRRLLPRYDGDLGSYRNFFNEDRGKYHQTGRFIERLGFLIKLRANEKYPDPADTECVDWAQRAKLEDKRDKYQKAYALKILRKALTEIHTPA